MEGKLLKEGVLFQFMNLNCMGRVNLLLSSFHNEFFENCCLECNFLVVARCVVGSAAADMRRSSFRGNVWSKLEHG